MMHFLHRLWRGLWRWMREPRILYRSEAPRLHTTIEVRTWLPFLMFLVALAWYVSRPSPVVMMTMITLGGLLLCSVLWARSMARGVRGERRLRFAAMQVGDELEEQIGLKNRSTLPVIWAEFIDRSNIPGYTVSSARAAESRGATSWRAHTICTRRGLFKLGPWELRLGEPFGLLTIRQLYLDQQEILVYPPLAELPEHVLPHRGSLGDHRPLNQPLRAETISSSTVRAYAAGDPLRHIHWPTTARRSAPFVKVFAPEAASSVWLVPDFDLSAHSGEGENNSQETMVTVTASLASELLRQNLSVGMYANAEKESVVLPRQGQAHLWSVLQALAPLNAAPGRALGRALDRVQALVTASDLLVIVTPSLDPEWIAPLRRAGRSRGGTSRAEVVLLDIDMDGRAEQFLRLLLEQGITASILRREDVRIISGTFGEISRWEFAVGGTGRVTTKRAPRGVEKLAEDAESAPWKILEP